MVDILSLLLLTACAKIRHHNSCMLWHIGNVQFTLCI